MRHLMYLCIGLGSHDWQKTSLLDLDYDLLDFDRLVRFDENGLW